MFCRLSTLSAAEGMKSATFAAALMARRAWWLSMLALFTPTPWAPPCVFLIRSMDSAILFKPLTRLHTRRSVSLPCTSYDALVTLQLKPSCGFSWSLGGLFAVG